MGSAAKALEIATEGLKATTCLQTYFGDADLVLKTAENWAVTDIGIDLYETDLRSVKMDHNKGLVLGIVDARNSVIEDAVYLSTIVKQIQETYKPKRLTVSTNCDMDFLTWDKAEAKMRILTLIAEKLGGK
jgi:methionine synthase II (cobalamin-independent)